MTLRLNFEVQHLLGLKEALIGCFVAMSFSRSIVEVCGDEIALAVRDSSHALSFGKILPEESAAFPLSMTSTLHQQRRSPSPAVADLVSR